MSSLWSGIAKDDMVQYKLKVDLLGQQPQRGLSGSVVQQKQDEVAEARGSMYEYTSSLFIKSFRQRMYTSV